MSEATPEEKAKQERGKRLADAIKVLLTEAFSSPPAVPERTMIRSDFAGVECTCGQPGCNSSGDMSQIAQPCHPGKGLEVAFFKSEGVLRLRCVACRSILDTTILVAKERDPVPVAAPAPAAAEPVPAPAPPHEVKDAGYETNPA